MAKYKPLDPPATCQRLTVKDKDLREIDRQDLVRMLYLLHLIRAFETRVLDLKEAELVHGPAHTSIGQEAVAAAVAAVLRKGDLIASTHRAHGHFLAKALLYYAPDDYRPLEQPLTDAMQQAVYRTLAEIMGLKDGWCGGRGGSMHLYDRASGNLGSNAIVGGGIPIATGAAWAQRLRGSDDIVVSFFGDGAINQGCFHEVANMASLWHAPILYLVENNLYAVGTGTDESSYVQHLAQRVAGYGFDSLIVDGMDPVAMYLGVRHATEAVRRRSFPFFLEAETYRYYHHAGRIAGSAFGYRDKDEEQAWWQRDPLVRYPAQLAVAGVVTASENEQLERLAKRAVDDATARCTEEVDGQRVIPAAAWPDPSTVSQHVRNEKALPAAADCVEEEQVAAERELTYVEAIAGVTLRAMERDERVIVLGEEVANLRGGAYQATRGIKEVYPDRLFNTPISETGFVGMAGGLASVGLRPVVEIMFPDFGLMSSDQLFNQIGKLRHMYGGQVGFPLLLRTRIASGYGYGGQHSMDPAGLFALFSGWRILAPSTAFDYVGLFNTALRLEDPVLLLEHGMIYADKGHVPEGPLDHCVPYGKARVRRAGSDVTVLSYLLSLTHCLQAAEELAAEGISAEVIDLRTLDLPGMDYAAIGASLAKTGTVLIVDQAPHSLSLGGRISDAVQARFFDLLDAPVQRVTAVDAPLAVSKRLEEAALPSVAQVKAAMRACARREV
jgi:2-oxoisovalerate dehydrogenase E1 component